MNEKMNEECEKASTELVEMLCAKFSMEDQNDIIRMMKDKIQEDRMMKIKECEAKLKELADAHSNM